VAALRFVVSNWSAHVWASSAVIELALRPSKCLSKFWKTERQRLIVDPFGFFASIHASKSFHGVSPAELLETLGTLGAASNDGNCSSPAHLVKNRPALAAQAAM